MLLVFNVAVSWKVWKKNIGKQREGYKARKEKNERKKRVRDEYTKEIIPRWISMNLYHSQK
jgi:hypothetical protein